MRPKIACASSDARAGGGGGLAAFVMLSRVGRRPRHSQGQASPAGSAAAAAGSTQRRPQARTRQNSRSVPGIAFAIGWAGEPAARGSEDIVRECGGLVVVVPVVVGNMRRVHLREASDGDVGRP